MPFTRNRFVTPLAQLAVEYRTASDFVIREAFTGPGYPHLAFFKFLSLHCVTSFSFIPCVSGISIDSYTFRDMKRFLAWLLKPIRNGPLRVFQFHSCLLACSSNLFHVSFCVTVRLHFCVLMFFCGGLGEQQNLACIVRLWGASFWWKNQSPTFPNGC